MGCTVVQRHIADSYQAAYTAAAKLTVCILVQKVYPAIDSFLWCGFPLPHWQPVPPDHRWIPGFMGIGRGDHSTAAGRIEHDIAQVRVDGDAEQTGGIDILRMDGYFLDGIVLPL